MDLLMSKKFDQDKLNKWDKDLKNWEQSEYFYSDELNEDNDNSEDEIYED